MSSSTAENTIAFFGATGGCANACLTHALKNGYYAVALARTPSKLTSQLLSQGLEKERLDAQLRIIQGDATDSQAVKKTILLSQSTDSFASTTTVVRKIICGIGGRPSFRMKLFFIPILSLDNPRITEESTRALLTALQEIRAESDLSEGEGSAHTKPVLTAISSTGVTSNGHRNDVPVLLRPLYHILFAKPHADKLRMEELLQQGESKSLLKPIIIKPSLLTGDGSIKNGTSPAALRVGTEKDPAVGYFVSRADVGKWIFEEVVKKDGDQWIGKKVSLTT